MRFDRAVEFYDRTRGLPPDVSARQAALLMRELRGSSRVLEIGVGTGRIGLTLDVPLIGLDLSRPMMEVLRSKREGVPVIEGDATRLPFPDDSFDTAYAAHVFHLIPTWKVAFGELVRVVRPGGLVLAVRGSGRTDVGHELNERAGFWRAPIGADTIEQVDDEARVHRLGVRVLPMIEWTAPYNVAEAIAGIENAEWSGLWKRSPEELRTVGRDLRTWAVERFGSVDAVVPGRSAFAWHAYDIPK